MFKMVMFMSCEIAFFKLNILDANFTNYYLMYESNFKGINLRKLCEMAIVTKCILTLDNLNIPLAEHYWNRYKDV